ncbi:MAG TPA: glycosyltransferase family 2 protein [Acidobacteriota bacterium]|nr:glycosyltransferase family 2 protein [Acidobacteriota bacterium]
MIPVFNERDNLGPLHAKLTQTLQLLGRSYEILFIDDGSTDGSNDILRQLAETDPHIRLLEFVRNFGQTAAMAAGFEHSQGEFVIPLDADLQNDPEDIPRIIDALEAGSDVVSCWRKDRQDPWLTRVLPSHMANWLISSISGVRLHDYGCTLKGYRRDIIRHIRLYGEMHRFIPIFATWAGARVTELPVRHHARQYGRSKYGIFRTVKVLLDLITIKFLGSFSTKPMYLFGGLGFLSFATGILLAAITLYQRFFYGVRAHRNPLLLLSVFVFFVGVQFILSGLVAELIVRTYHESQGKRTYILRERNPSGSEVVQPSRQKQDQRSMNAGEAIPNQTG